MQSGHPFQHFMRQSHNIDNQGYYDILGISKDASSTEIKKAFRKKAIKEHPDRGGDEELFKKISEAYEVLSDETNKEKYDRCGKEGINSNDINNSDIYDILSGNRRGTQQNKGKDIIHKLKVQLENFYTGITKKLSIPRKIISASNKEPSKCSTCKGYGRITHMKQCGGNMIQQVQSQCPKCNGDGYICKFITEKKQYKIVIEKGVKDGAKIKFEGEGNQSPNGPPGDIIIILTQIKHSIFTRKHNDLYMNQDIYLSDSLCGAKFIVNHLDDRPLLISSKDILTPDMHKMVIGEGMPIHENPFSKGNLIINFTIIFPDKLLMNDDKKNITSILPIPKSIDIPNNIEFYDLEEVNIQNENQNQNQAYDSDDESDDPHNQHHHHGPIGQQCAQS